MINELCVPVLAGAVLVACSSDPPSKSPSYRLGRYVGAFHILDEKIPLPSHARPPLIYGEKFNPTTAEIKDACGYYLLTKEIDRTNDPKTQEISTPVVTVQLDDLNKHEFVAGCTKGVQEKLGR